MIRYYLLLTHLPIPMDSTISTGPLAVSVENYYLLLAHWLSLWYTIIFNWPTDSPYGTLAYSSGQLALPMIHYHFLLAHWPSLWCSQYILQAHWLSLWYTSLYFWPIGCLCGALIYSIGPLAVSMLVHHLLLADWLSQ